jgi:hypothetical protein
MVRLVFLVKSMEEPTTWLMTANLHRLFIPRESSSYSPTHLASMVFGSSLVQMNRKEAC